MDKIFVKLKACGCAFFRMELGRENIFMSDSTAEKGAIFGIADYMFLMFWNSVKTVDEIKEAFVVNTFPKRVRPVLNDLVPSHLGDFVSRAVVLALIVQSESYHFARNKAESLRIAFFTPVEKHLFSDTNSENRFFPGRFDEFFFQA